jgi:hypothetical protein
LIQNLFVTTTRSHTTFDAGHGTILSINGS